MKTLNKIEISVFCKEFEVESIKESLQLIAENCSSKELRLFATGLKDKNIKNFAVNYLLSYGNSKKEKTS